MRQIQAYFHTENEAEDVRVKLQTCKHENLEIGALPEPLDREIPLLLPLAFAAGTYGGPVGNGYAPGITTGAAAAGTYVGLRSLDEEAHDRNEDGVDDRALLYSLSVQVPEEDYIEAVELIRHEGGHVAYP